MAPVKTKKRNGGRSNVGNPKQRPIRKRAGRKSPLPDENAGTALQIAIHTRVEEQQTTLCIEQTAIVQGLVVEDGTRVTSQEVVKSLEVHVESEIPRTAQNELDNNVVVPSVDQETAVVNQEDGRHNIGSSKIVGPARNWPPRQKQHFAYFLVMDLEWTCDKGDKQPEPQEIWEFATVLFNADTLKIEGTFQTFVRPTEHPVLTDFCKQVTGGKQKDVDRGTSLQDALEAHDNWLLEKRLLDERQEEAVREREDMVDFAVVTWSSGDCKILDAECRYKKIRKPAYFDRWIDLREFWTRMPGYRDVEYVLQGGLEAHVEYSGLE
ncbi:hypothetical protein KFL_000500300 [Klebsormidium nitens]|uniref:Exonuclease domain-containing protein n=1 Tax=Klebsormidium nitens TaxID=105231 RepID=A0A1Y1HUR2_KLENI|nr:hypothetical protein KFL_000500300 [Klebsormidium nitens]|eukprot:GAQ80277.1 hypothetical protein KFL_000500300 [Klebsormidium nitens]